MKICDYLFDSNSYVINRSLPQLSDILLFDLSELTSNLGMKIFKGTISVFHEHIFQINKYFLLFWLALDMKWAKGAEYGATDTLLDAVIVVLLRRLTPILLLFQVFLIRDWWLDFHLLLLDMRGLELRQIINIFLLLLVVDDWFRWLCFDSCLVHFLFGLIFNSSRSRQLRSFFNS